MVAIRSSYLVTLTLEEEIDLIQTIEQQELNIFIDTNSMLQSGYAFLTDKTKLLYFYMKEIANTNNANITRSICYASEEHLSIVTNSSVKTIKNSINSLFECFLITENKDHYIIHNATLESTFKETIEKLLYRKKIISTLSYRVTCNAPKKRIEQLYDLMFITKQAEESPHLRDVYNFYKKRIEHITGNSLTYQNTHDSNKMFSDSHHISLLS